jgi:hypothetical protein
MIDTRCWRQQENVNFKSGSNSLRFSRFQSNSTEAIPTVPYLWFKSRSEPGSTDLFPRLPSIGSDRRPPILGPAPVIIIPMSYCHRGKLTEQRSVPNSGSELFGIGPCVFSESILLLHTILHARLLCIIQSVTLLYLYGRHFPIPAWLFQSYRFALFTTGSNTSISSVYQHYEDLYDNDGFANRIIFQSWKVKASP